MKAHLKTSGGKLVVEIQAETIKGLFQEIASVQEILDADQLCGCCSGPNIRFKVREVDSFSFYEMTCIDCYARLSFGQRKDGGLFAKRKDDAGNYLPNSGWSVYRA